MTNLEKVCKYYKGSKKSYIGKYIKAMERLIFVYEEGVSPCLCPLCEVAVSVSSSCDCCPWWVLTGGGCRYRSQTIREGKVRQRVAELRRWIAVYRKALRRGVK